MTFLIPSILFGVLAFQVWVTVRLWRTGLYERSEKWLQSKLIWLVPLVGAAIVMSVLDEENKTHRPGSHESR